MILSARFLTNAANVNSFDYSEFVEFVEGDTVTVYLQLVDSSKDLDRDGFKPAGRRYVPVSGATLTVTVDNINDAKKVIRAASQPFANDPSIWSFQIMATDTVKGTANLRLTLTESGVVRKGFIQPAFRVWPATPV
jgi:hypothetical protein